MENRIYQRHRHAVTINDGDVNRVFVNGFAYLFWCGHSAFWIDQPRKFFCNVWGQHMIKLLGVIWISEKTITRVIG